MRLIGIALMASALTACVTAEADQAARVSLEGTVAYRERVALPADARILVEVRDVSLQDTASVLIASEEFAANGRQVPVRFSLSYEAAKIVPRHSYAVSARITDASGGLMFITDTRIPLPPAGETVALNLVRVPARTP